MSRIGDIFKAMHLVQYLPLIVALSTKFQQTLTFTDGILDRLEDAATGKADFVLKAGSPEAIRLDATLKRLHDLTNRIQQDGGL